MDHKTYYWIQWTNLSATLARWVAHSPSNTEDVLGFNPRYRQIHSGLDVHLEWRTPVIESYLRWQVYEPQGH